MSAQANVAPSHHMEYRNKTPTCKTLLSEIFLYDSHFGDHISFAPHQKDCFNTVDKDAASCRDHAMKHDYVRLDPLPGTFVHFEVMDPLSTRDVSQT